MASKSLFSDLEVLYSIFFSPTKKFSFIVTQNGRGKRKLLKQILLIEKFNVGFPYK